MAKTIHCRYMGADCDFVARGETMEDVLAVGAEHGKAVHGISEIKCILQARQPIRG